MVQRTIAVVDGNSIIHRAFHALPPTMTATDGRPTNAVFGFVQMMLKMVEVLGPDGVVVAWDVGRPAFRSAVLEQYKAHRPPTDPLLKSQFATVREVLDAMNVPQLSAEGWEADDILGTLAAKAEAAGARVLLVTGDKDSFQLVDDNVSVVSTRKGLTDIVVYDRQGVFDRLGVYPEQVPDYLGLKGDTSDNIPGVPGVGEKTAAKLLAEHGSLDAVIDAAEGIKGKLGENLRGNVGAARASREVATIRRDAPVDIDLNAVSWGPFDEAALAGVFAELQFTTLMAKLLGAERGAAPRGSVPAPHRAPAAAPEPAKAAAAWHVSTGPGAARTVSGWLADPAAPLLGVALAAEGADTLLPVEELGVGREGMVAVVEDDSLVDTLRAVLRAPRFAAPDVKALLDRVCPAGSCPPDDPTVAELSTGAFDVALAAYLLDSGRSSYLTDVVYADIFCRPVPAATDQGGVAAVEARAVTELAPALRERLEADGSAVVFDTIEMPLVPVLARMERVGVALDTAVLAELSAEAAAGIERLRAEIIGEAGREFTIDSPKQLGEVLFDEMGLPRGKRTKTGWSTDASVLGELAPAFPIAGKVLDYRELTKLKSTYIDALPRLLGADGRLHTTFNQTVAATGRLSSSNPNLQNIPVRTELGMRIRAAFVPGTPGDLMVSADYSQIELRVLAHLSGDQGLIDAFTSGEDFHTATAARVFGLDPDAIDPEHRRRAKAVNFGIVYGQTAHGLATTLSIGHAEAQEMIDRYFAAYPGVRAYLDATVAEAHREGFAVTAYGRKRRIPELVSSNFNPRSFGERTAMNHPMQGTAADIMKLAMLEVDATLRASGLDARMVLQVHDELVFECAPADVAALERLVVDAMVGVADLAVPLEVSVGSGPDWASAK
jgi:DNA polymerase-1